MRVIILGATSAIAEATARLYAQEGADLLLVGRQTERLRSIAADLKLRGAARAEISLRDLSQTEKISTDFRRYVEMLGGVDHVLLAYGVLGDQASAERDLAAAEANLEVNFGSAALWSLAAAEVLEKQGQGTLIVLGSVAGDRGRCTNFIYGAAKAGLAALIQGIAHRFGSTGPRAVIVKPGPTITPMTQGLTRKDLLWSTPEQIARITRRAAERGGPICYAPWFWRFIMLIIRFLPAPIFNRVDI